MRNMKYTLVWLMLLGLLAGLAGCGGDDDSPTSVPTGDTMTLDNATAEQYSMQALEIVNSMIIDVPTIAVGDFGTWSTAKAELAKAGDEDVTWDPAQNAWVYDFTGPLLEVDPPSYWNITIGLWVQFRNGDLPLEFPIGATEMEVRSSTGMDMHIVSDEGVLDLSYDMNTQMIVSYLGEGGTYGVVGSGDTMVDVMQVSPQGSQGGHFTMEWAMDVVVSEGGCPSGTATVTTQEFRLDAMYDGEGNVNWSIFGPNFEAHGTDELACGVPVLK